MTKVIIFMAAVGVSVTASAAFAQEQKPCPEGRGHIAEYCGKWWPDNKGSYQRCVDKSMNAWGPNVCLRLDAKPQTH